MVRCAIVTAGLLHVLLGASGVDARTLASASVDSQGTVLISVSDAPSFDHYVRQYGRTYLPGSAEYLQRQAYYHDHVEKVVRHNSKPRRSWTAAVNHLADRSPEERRRLRNRQTPKSEAVHLAETRTSNKFVRLSQAKGMPEGKVTYNVSGLPTDFSWKGRLEAMGDIHEQGACGACWAHSTSVVLRAHAELYQTDRTFSVQELIACANNTHECGGQGACDGAAPQMAFAYFAERGLRTEEEWPYEEKRTACLPPSKAKAGKGKPKALVPEPVFEWEGTSLLTSAFFIAPLHGRGREFGYTGFTRLGINKADEVMRAVYELGPVAAVVYADMSWDMYSTGVLDACTIGDDDWVIDHSVVIAGFGVQIGDVAFGEQGMTWPYWLVQNSWGIGYGEHGFVRLHRKPTAKEESEKCSFDIRPDYADWCSNWPLAKVPVCGACGLLYDTVLPIFELSDQGLLARNPGIREMRIN